MAQSIQFKGYKVSGFADEVDSGEWNAWYLIEKGGDFVRMRRIVDTFRFGVAAEAAAVLHGAQAVEGWTTHAEKTFVTK
jgi:hypothetical protein